MARETDSAKDRRSARSKRLGRALVTVGALALFFPPAIWAQSLVAAVLPASRSVQVGTPATAFATIINAGGAAATGCSIAPATSVSASFVYQTTDPATNAVTSTANTPVGIAAGGSQTFVLAFTPTAPISPTDVVLTFGCTNAQPATTTTGLNTLLLSASSSPIPDVVALAATLSNDGIVNIPGTAATGVFSVATVNVGASGSITASADTGAATLPVSISLCETNPTSGACLAAPAGGVTTQIDANATPTFGVFIQGTADVPFDPAGNRVFMRFKDSGGVTRGSTSVAVRTFVGVSGTAAAGGPIAGAAVGLKDRDGNAQAATTNSRGKFEFNVLGLTAPFLLKVVDPSSGSSLFSVGSQAGVVNIHPFTDLLIGTWYGVQNLDVAAEFAALSGSSRVPSSTEVAVIATVVKDIVRMWLTGEGLDPEDFDLITTSFSADGTGFDKVLDSSSVDRAAGTVSIKDDPASPTVTQSTSLTLDTQSSSVTVDTTTTGPQGTSSSTTTAIVPVTSPLQAAVNGILATLEQFKSTVNSKGSNLAASDLLPFYAQDFLNDSNSRDGDAAETADNFRGAQILSGGVRRVLSFDGTNQVMKVIFFFSLAASGGTTNAQEDEQTFKKIGSDWLFFGNQRIGGFEAQSRVERVAAGSGTTTDKVLHIFFQALEGRVSGVTVSGGPFSNTPVPKTGQSIDLQGRRLDEFNIREVVQAFSSPGTVFTFTVTPTTGSPQTTQETLNAFTTEPISITNLTGFTLAEAKLGQPLDVEWALPTTFPIAKVQVIPVVFNSQNTLCDVQGLDLGPTSTSGTITFPTTCDGQPVVKARPDVFVTGSNGEITVAIYEFGGP